MGMDVYGKNPKNDLGEYFRNNWWYWRPLWEFCEFVAPDIAGKVENAGSNDGDGLDDEDAIDLGTVLRHSVEDGTAQAYKEEREAFLATLPIRPCPHCQSTGKRTWYTSPDGGQRESSLSYDLMKMLLEEQEVPEYTTITKPEGWSEETVECNGCGGSGGQPHPLRSYPFEVENVSEFATFLVNCGGFELW